MDALVAIFAGRQEWWPKSRMSCEETAWVLLIPVATSLIRLVLFYAWFDRILILRRHNHYCTLNQLYLGLFGAFSSALVNYVFIADYASYIGCPRIAMFSWIAAAVSLLLTLAVQLGLQLQIGVSRHEYEAFAISATDSSQYLGVAIRRRHAHDLDFRAWVTATLASQSLFIANTRRRLRGLPPLPVLPSSK
jgi:hypothetical protein